MGNRRSTSRQPASHHAARGHTHLSLLYSVVYYNRDTEDDLIDIRLWSERGQQDRVGWASGTVRRRGMRRAVDERMGNMGEHAGRGNALTIVELMYSEDVELYFIDGAGICTGVCEGGGGGGLGEWDRVDSNF